MDLVDHFTSLTFVAMFLIMSVSEHQTFCYFTPCEDLVLFTLLYRVRQVIFLFSYEYTHIKKGVSLLHPVIYSYKKGS
jgi:hypothetical protein